MTEKVLGFKEKNCCDWAKKQWCEVCRQYEYSVPDDKLVPVVSVEWVEKWCEEHQYIHIDRFLDKYPPSVFTRGLLKAVRLQAKKEAKKKNE